MTQFCSIPFAVILPAIFFVQADVVNRILKRRALKLLLVAPLMLMSTSLVFALGAFTPGAVTSVDFGPSSISTGDYNRDGRVDLAVLHRGRQEISVLSGNGDGSFGAPTVQASTATPVRVITQEFSQDAREDMVSVGGFALGLSRGNGAGAFGSFATTTVPQEIFGGAAVAGDFNEDGRTDVIVITAAGLRVFTSTGVRLNPLGAPIPALSAATSIVAADFNRDGHLDVAFTRFGQSTTIGVMFGNGNGTFQPMQVYICGEDPFDLVVADFDRDGFPDIAASTFGATRPIAILLNDHSGGFLGPKFPVTSKPDQIAVADMDHNGTADLVVFNRALRRIEVLRGNGDGTFAATADVVVTIPGTTGIGGFAIATLNDDLLPDIAVAMVNPTDPTLGQVATFLNPVEHLAEGMINFSTRVRVEKGSTVTIGFVVDRVTTTVLIRALGPGLKALGGSTEVLQDPTLSVFQGATKLTSNDNWSSNIINRALVEVMSRKVGAVPLTVGSKDAAVLVTLAPGAYTATVQATDAGSGDALIEVFRADQL